MLRSQWTPKVQILHSCYCLSVLPGTVSLNLYEFLRGTIRNTKSDKIEIFEQFKLQFVNISLSREFNLLAITLESALVITLAV